MIKTMYKIRRREDGLFSTGGNYPDFNSVGKIWKGTGPLKNHIKGVTSYDSRRDKPAYTGCDIIEVEVNELRRIDAIEFINEHKLFYTKN